MPRTQDATLGPSFGAANRQWEHRSRRKRLLAFWNNAHRAPMLFDLQPPGALLLYAFRFVDPVTGKWIRARYVAELHEIAARHERWEITGGPEIRSRAAAMFSPSAKLPPRPARAIVDAAAIKEQPVQEPALDELEHFLVLVFLRRYVTYCARRGRYAAMNGAARLFAEVRAPRGASLG